MSASSILNVKGTITRIFPEQTFSPKFKKQQVSLTTNDKYPQTILFDFVNDKIDLLNGYMEGESVQFAFNLRGNEYKGKPINSLTVWKIERVDAELTNAVQNNSRVEANIDLEF